jgi:hypothetical protein
MPEVLKSNYKILKQKKAQELGRVLTDAEISRETGVPTSTLGRIAATPPGNATMENLGPLAAYFGVHADEVVEWAPDTPGTGKEEG